jgi:flagellar biogenesis protein FliO
MAGLDERKGTKLMDNSTLIEGAEVVETPFKKFLQWAQRATRSRKTRRLRVRESLSLGERRFLAVVEFDSQEFLVGGTGSSLALLARLHDGMILPETPQPAQAPLV